MSLIRVQRKSCNAVNFGNSLSLRAAADDRVVVQMRQSSTTRATSGHGGTTSAGIAPTADRDPPAAEGHRVEQRVVGRQLHVEPAAAASKPGAASVPADAVVHTNSDGEGAVAGLGNRHPPNRPVAAQRQLDDARSAGEARFAARRRPRNMTTRRRPAGRGCNSQSGRRGWRWRPHGRRRLGQRKRGQQIAQYSSFQGFNRSTLACSAASSARSSSIALGAAADALASLAPSSFALPREHPAGVLEHGHVALGDLGEHGPAEARR